MSNSNQSGATIFSLQTYITELTCYINQNNAKYTKNLETVKTFYESQVMELQQKIILLEEQKLQLRNELLPTRDVLNNKQAQLKDMKYRLDQSKQQNQQLRQKLNNQRKKIDQLYEDLQNAKRGFRQQLDTQDQIVKEIENEKNDLLLKLKERDQQISRLNKDAQRLQDMVSERYSLPEKLKDIEIQSAKNKTMVQALNQTKKDLQTKIDFLENQLQRLRKENKRLQINYESRDANAKKQVSETLIKQKQTSQERQKRLQSANEKQLFQVNQLQNSLKSLKRQNSELQKKLNDYIEQVKHLSQRIQNHDAQKDRYIQEFQKLKHQYEEVIKNLQNTLPKYQKKNWDLQQQNRDLNVQLDGLRDVLTEIKAMNSLQPLKHEYRQIAELELLAQKDYKAYKNEENFKPQTKKISSSNITYNDQSQIAGQNEESDFKWDQLLADIDKIQVS